MTQQLQEKLLIRTLENPVVTDGRFSYLVVLLKDVGVPFPRQERNLFGKEDEKCSIFFKLA